MEFFMKQVFVSYASPDKVIAHEIVEFLEKVDISCFIAPRDIDGGKAYAKALMEAIDQCDLFVLVASSAIIASDHVLNEVEAVVNKKKEILPILVEDFEMSDEFKYYLGRKQWITAYPEDVHSYFEKIRDLVLDILPKKEVKPIIMPDPEPISDGPKTTIFEYVPSRGIMINPEDHQRNVSFRTDTFVNMMGEIYEKIEALVGEPQAQEIFFNSGYASGKNFAERISNQWDFGYHVEDIKLKFDKWCKFDSAVGWGRFSANLELDPETDSIGGSICINEAFIVDNKKKRKICNFIKGYCTGVCEVLLNSSEVELVCAECPLNSKFKTKCVMEIKTK